MKVTLHTRSHGHYDWHSDVREFGRVPMVGEHVALSAGSPWYAVQLVVHLPYPGSADAEVYAVEVDQDTAKHHAFRGGAPSAESSA